MIATLLLGVYAVSATLDMIPEDGTCLPGETIQVFAPEPTRVRNGPAHGPQTRAWTVRRRGRSPS